MSVILDLLFRMVLHIAFRMAKAICYDDVGRVRLAKAYLTFTGSSLWLCGNFCLGSLGCPVF